MLKRAERFGLPLKKGAASESDTAEILAKRQKRFGPVVGSGVCFFVLNFNLFLLDLRIVVPIRGKDVDKKFSGWANPGP